MDITDGETTGGDGLPGPASRKLQGTNAEKRKSRKRKAETGKGGKATTSQSAGRIEQSVVQSDNPAAVSKQVQETVRTKSYTVPAGSRLVETRIVTEGGAPVTNSQVLLISAPMS